MIMLATFAQRFGHHGRDGHHRWWLAALVFWLLVVAAVVAVVALVRSQRSGPRSVVANAVPAATTTAHPSPAVADGAVEHVRMRYARGEIGRDEFLRLASYLGAAPPTSPSPDPNEA